MFPVDVIIKEKEDKFASLIKLFFMGMKGIDKIVESCKNENEDVKIDIRKLEKFIVKRKTWENAKIPSSEKLLVIEGYIQLHSFFSTSVSHENEWKVNYFRFTEFSIVQWKY
jgi:hypothetical protein